MRKVYLHPSLGGEVVLDGLDPQGMPRHLRRREPDAVGQPAGGPGASAG